MQLSFRNQITEMHCLKIDLLACEKDLCWSFLKNSILSTTCIKAQMIYTDGHVQDWVFVLNWSKLIRVQSIWGSRLTLNTIIRRAIESILYFNCTSGTPQPNISASEHEHNLEEIKDSSYSVWTVQQRVCCFFFWLFTWRLEVWTWFKSQLHKKRPMFRWIDMHACVCEHIYPHFLISIAHTCR